MNYGIVLAILFVILTMVYLIVFKALDVKNEHSCREDMSKCKNMSHKHDKSKQESHKSVNDFIKSNKNQSEEYYFSGKSLKKKKTTKNNKIKKEKNVKNNKNVKNSKPVKQVKKNTKKKK